MKANNSLRILLHGLNFAPEKIGVGKYSGEMVEALTSSGCDVTVVTTPPYYPDWKVAKGYRSYWYQALESSHALDRTTSLVDGIIERRDSPNNEGSGNVRGVRCPIWVPAKVNGWKRILHLFSFGLSSMVPVLWYAVRWRPHMIITVEPAAVCMPTTLLAARLVGAKAWLHVQDFEVDAAFELGLIRSELLKRIVSGIEGFLMRKFDRVSSISRNMVLRLYSKGVPMERCVLFPNWVDCHRIRPLARSENLRQEFGLPADKCIALYAGNFGAKQGLELVIEAARLCRDDPNLHFVISGDGCNREELMRRGAGLANLQFLPLQPEEKFNRLLNCADFHLLPQRADAADLVMPSKLTGMLASGRPILACASPGTQIADVVEGLGLVVAPGSAQEIADGVRKLATAPMTRLLYGAAAREYALSQLSREAILRSFQRRLWELVYPQTDLPEYPRHPLNPKSSKYPSPKPFVTDRR
ncbi:MAG: glycosyltransferase WbuB [bacterium]|nr:glycosyltransferase WbuB [bacterium]